MIKETEVDGVPTLIAPVSGQMHAGLVFRVGYADEVLARAGITHVVEHLALFRTGQADYHYNGRTGAATTEFHLRGSEQDVVAFLTGVCEALSALPFERLEVEKQVLRTEQAGKSPSPSEVLALWRYGARGFGLAGYPEYGVPNLTPDEIRHWVGTWFTRENAGLWIAGDGVPAGLRLPLPSGRRWAPPPVTSALPVTPAFFQAPMNGTAFDAVVPRGPAAMVYAEVLQRELFRELRQADGLSYTTAAGYTAHPHDTAIVTAIADALPEKQSAVLGGMVDALHTLAVGRIEQTEVDAVIAAAQGDLQHPDAAAASLSGLVTNLLTGRPIHSPEERTAQLGAVTLDEVRAVAAQALRTGLLLVPEDHTADWAGYAVAPITSETVVEGGAYPVIDDPNDRFVIGPAGVSRVIGDQAATVRYTECAAMLVWPDGGRQLVGHDGMRVAVEPTMIAADPGLLHHIGAGLPPHLVVRLPPRDPSTIPRPAPPTPDPPPEKRGGLLRRRKS
ncbi:M16 family metallopeptidase [Cryptosporangium aurantiacum]|uniref:Predicted Zn-dependent peptidase n=1 Tax=Cryptosporangium aurantiacum TaxID=134849 RepID=A0A1M7JWS0_9ACTN|nr:insulinase family protein [Cryptosporangium aurantiacum]SHM57530.1 Predicted Zn-dependent peptidase [Cryptosporangium aurantiacum]